MKDKEVSVAVDNQIKDFRLDLSRLVVVSLKAANVSGSSHYELPNYEGRWTYCISRDHPTMTLSLNIPPARRS
jgi:hypothetical protein